MTPARNNVRATRHFGIPARKSSPNNSPILAKPRKNSPSTPLQPFPREKTRPTTASPWPNREKTRPARPKTPKSSHFSRAGRTFSRFQHRTTEQGEFSPATTPLKTHHRDTTTPTGTKPTQQRRRQRAQPGARVSTRYKTLPALPPQSPTGTKLSQQHPPQGTTDTKLSQHAHNQRKLAISREQGESFPVPNATPPSRENFLPQQHHLGVSFNAADRLVPTFTRHQTNTSLSWALCGLLTAHHDAAPERAGTGRRLADWKRPRNPQTSSQQPTTRTKVSDVRPRHPQASFQPKLSTGTCVELERHDQSAHS